MNNTGLKLRMAVVGTILFALYFGAALVFSEMFQVSLLPILAISLVLLPAAQYKIGKWMALRGTEEMPDEGQYRQIHQMTESLARDMGMDKPKLVVQDMGVPNAFATGRRGAGVVCVSNELIGLLDRDELEGVIAHELAHLDNRDTITMIIGQSIGMIVSYAVFFLLRDDNNFLVAYAGSVVAQMLTMIFVMLSRDTASTSPTTTHASTSAAANHSPAHSRRFPVAPKAASPASTTTSARCAF